jgi:sugar lactone lactonase YvrE
VPVRFAFSLTSALLLGAACARKDAAPAADAAAAATPTRVSSIDGFNTPESVLWDAEQQVWFVSNINGSPVAKDGNGYISRLDREGAVEKPQFIAGGQGSVVLHAPKGLAIVGDTLWVADIDAMRGFNRRTGSLVATVEFGAQARFLNDVAAGADGTIYITDTGVGMDDKGNFTHPGPDRVFALSGRRITIALEGDWLARPNGIAWDEANARFILAPFGGPAIIAWKPGEQSVDTLGTGPGGFDGVEVLGGEAYVTSWADSTLYALGAGGLRKVATGVNSPADIGLDPTRDLIAIPLFLENRVEVWRVR